MIDLLAIAAAAQTATSDLAAPPTIRRGPKETCECPSPRETHDLIISGLVVDAELTLAPDKRSANDRQATIFEMARPGPDGEKRIRIFHSTMRAKCGVTFDYGLKYIVPVRKTEDGALETNMCLTAMPEAEAADVKMNAAPEPKSE